MKRNHHNDHGAVMVEFAVVFPWILLLTLAIIQLALIFVGKIVVTYAAFAATRAEMVNDDDFVTVNDEAKVSPELAAEIVCSRIAGRTVKPGTRIPQPIQVPGWGNLHASEYSILKTSATVISSGRPGDVTVKVVHDFELVIPFANHMFKDESSDEYDFPHLKLTETWTMYRPWGNPDLSNIHPNPEVDGQPIP